MITALLLITALAAESDPASDAFDTFFQEFAKKRAGIEILEADIVEETIQYGDVTRREGNVLFGKPRRILFRYTGDEPSMMIDHRRVYEFDPGAEQLQIYEIEDSPESSIFFLGFDSDPAALREAYDVRVFTMKSDVGQRGIEIRPYKENLNQAPFTEVTIYLRDSDYLPHRIDIEFDQDTRMVTDFSNYRINHAVDPARTQLRIPAGTRVIENGEVTIRAVPGGGIMMPPAPLDAAVAETDPADTPPANDRSEPAVQAEELPAP